MATTLYINFTILLLVYLFMVAKNHTLTSKAFSVLHHKEQVLTTSALFINAGNVKHGRTPITARRTTQKESNKSSKSVSLSLRLTTTNKTHYIT